MPWNPSLAALSLPVEVEWIALGLSYLVGSIPFGWILAKLIQGVDVRNHGSGNIGATNVGRVLGRPLGFLAFLLDLGKGWLPVAVIAPQFSQALEGEVSLQVLCGIAAAIGHVWPVYLGFRGGKAVATVCGVMIALDPMIFMFGGVVWLLTLFSTDYVGLSSIAMVLVFPVVAWQRYQGDSYGSEVFWGSVALAILILFRHRSNIARMLAGTEPRTRRKQDTPGED